MPEGVGEPCLEQARHLLSFLVGEPSVLAVCLRVFQVDFLMGHVEVAAYDDGFLGLQLLEELQKVVLPLHAVVEPPQTVLRVGGIAGDEIEVVEFECDDAPLVVVDVDAHAVGDAQGVDAGEDGCSGVSFFLGIVPIAFIALEGDVCLSGLEFCFLQAEAVGIECAETFFKAFFAAGTQAVDIP